MEINHEGIVMEIEKEEDILSAINLLKQCKIIPEKFDLKSQYLTANIKFEYLTGYEIGIIN